MIMRCGCPGSPLTGRSRVAAAPGPTAGPPRGGAPPGPGGGAGGGAGAGDPRPGPPHERGPPPPAVRGEFADAPGLSPLALHERCTRLSTGTWDLAQVLRELAPEPS